MQWRRNLWTLKKRALCVAWGCGLCGDCMRQQCKEYSQMLLALDFYDPRPAVREWIMAAYHDPNWDWEGCDGCTMVSEARFPKGYKYPPCVMHDYICENWKRLGVTRAFGDLMFFYAMIDFKMWPPKAIWRWAGVRSYWLLIGKWMKGAR